MIRHHSRVKQRSAAIDVLRILGIVAIVIGHVWDNVAIRELLYTWHVPIFFILTGYLWTSGRSLLTEFQNRFRSLILPYITWLFLISALYFPWENYRTGAFPMRTLAQTVWGGELAGRPFSAFWFVTALFFGALMLRILERVGPWAGWAASIAGVTVAYVTEGFLGKLPLSVGTAVPCALFILIGDAARRIPSRLRTSTNGAAIGCILVAGSAALVALGVSAPLDLKKADFGTPLVSVGVASAISLGLILIAGATIHPGARYSKLITQLAAGGILVVLTHPVVLWILGTPSTGRWQDFFAALLIPWTAAIILAKTRIAPYLLGVRTDRNQAPSRTTPTARSSSEAGKDG